MDREISIGDLARELIAQINPSAKIVTKEERLRPEKSEVERLLGSATKIKSLTDWSPKYDLAAGLAETIAWFKRPEHLARYKSELYNI